MGQLYDLMLLLDAEAPSERREQVLHETEAAVKAGGAVEGTHDWGVRKMIYEIAHRADAHYHLMQFTGSRELLETLQRTLRLNDTVVRFRIIKVKPGTPPPPAVRAPAPATAEPPADPGHVAAEPAPEPEPATESAPAAAEPAAEPARVAAESPGEPAPEPAAG